MSIPQNVKQPKSSTLSQLFTSFHFFLLGVVLLIIAAVMFWLHQQDIKRFEARSELHAQTIFDVSQDRLAIQAASQELSTLLVDLKQTMQNLDQRQYSFLKSNQHFMVTPIYQEATLAQALVIKAFMIMEKLDNVLGLAHEHASLYQTQSAAHASHFQHVQDMQNKANSLGRAVYKLSWKFEELATALSRTIYFTRNNGFEFAASHYAVVGTQKTNAMDSSMVTVASKLDDMRVTIDESMDLFEQIIWASSIKPLQASVISKTHQWSLITVIAGLFAVAAIWSHGVLKPRVALSQQAEALNQPDNNFAILATPKGEWGAIALSLANVAKHQQELGAQHSAKAQELEQLKHAMVTVPNFHEGALNVDAVANSQDSIAELAHQQTLPGFEQHAASIN